MRDIETKYIVFSDLDGTLLDHHTYLYEAARPALELLRATGTPLVMVSSKTRYEIEPLRRELDIHDPFISENGGAVFFPKSNAPLPAGAADQDKYQISLLGLSKEKIDTAFDRLAARFPIRGFSRLAADEISSLTGLSLEQAEAARRREFGEVVILENLSLLKDFEDAVKSEGLRLTQGARFLHLIGDNDKGRAVKIVADAYRLKHPGIITVGVGDAPNDAPMLKAVDFPFLVAAPDGTHRDVKAPHLEKISKPGPTGFCEAVMKSIGEKRKIIP